MDSDGSVLQSMDDKEGIGIADVALDPRRKTGASQVCTGIGIAELSIGGSEGAAAVAEEYSRGTEILRDQPSPQGEGACDIRKPVPRSEVRLRM